MINIQIKEAKKVNGKQGAFISFPYNTELVSIMREQPARAWHSDCKKWEIPAEKLINLLPKLDGFKIEIKGDYSHEEESNITTLPDGFIFKTTPFNHQIEGLQYGLSKDSFLLGDEQGLGKTKQVIDIAVAKKLTCGYKHCLIICGVNGLKHNWQAEITTHSNEKSFILGTRYNSTRSYVGSNNDKLHDLKHLKEDTYFYITNVESLRNDGICSELKALCDKGIIEMVAIDEIHRCKNPSSQQGKAILKIQAKTRIAMTGTPLMNQPLDLFIVLKWLGYERHSFFQFKNHYCTMGGFGGYEVIGYKNLNQLQESLSGLMLRRLKKDVLDLPEKIHTTEYVEMSNAQTKLYNDIKAQIENDIDKIKVSPNPLAMLIRLRQATGYTGILSSTLQESAKLDRLEEIIEELAENGKKAIIFSNWTDMTTPTHERLKKYNPAIITGETKDRVAEQDRFTNDSNCKVIIGTIGAMGTGLTLTAASTVIFLDSPWNRANKEQAEDRAHRIGTKSNVNIITLVCKDTIDERIEEIIYKKGAMADLLVDGKVDTSRTELIEYLLN